MREPEAANNHIRQLEGKLALLVTENDDSIKTWSMQDRKGRARWQTVKKYLTQGEAEKMLDKLAGSKSSGNYTYRIIEE